MKRVMSYNVQFGAGSFVIIHVLLEGNVNFTRVPNMSATDGAVALVILGTKNAHMDPNFTFYCSQATNTLPFIHE